jgi:hypothetical protein
MSEPKFEKPPIYMSETGIAYVKAKDILLSQKGQEEIYRLCNVLEKSRHFKNCHN